MRNFENKQTAWVQGRNQNQYFLCGNIKKTRQQQGMKKVFNRKFLAMIAVLILNLNIVAQSLSWIELFGLEDLVTDLVKATPTVHYTGEQSVSYAVDDKLMNFLKNFQTRTEFCNFKCPQFYQLTCFILFQCNIQIRNFTLTIILPILLIGLVGLCCGRGIWTLECWAKYIAVFTGIFLIIWFIKKFTQGHKIVQRRKKQREFMKQQRKGPQIQIQPVLTEKRFIPQS